MTKKIGIIGYGFLGESLYEYLKKTDIKVCAIFNRSSEKTQDLPDALAFTEMRDFMSKVDGLDLVVELAHPDISRDWGGQILERCDYMPCSVAALANKNLKENLKENLLKAAKSGCTRLLVPHGAVVGIDNIYEARENWQEVTITFRKPPTAIDLDNELEGDETVLFDGPVTEIAEKYPRNVNAMVACALATVGTDAARARFVADRRMNNMLRGEFEFKGKDGSTLSIVKEEPAVGVSSPGMVTSIIGSVLRALQVDADGLNFV
ncbi:MAG: DUF108 domain-containing protein [Gammaproteobacteria bacterium]|nr:DUF108 domain-containing protein [Gammaproteobacteria bacterium]